MEDDEVTHDSHSQVKEAHVEPAAWPRENFIIQYWVQRLQGVMLIVWMHGRLTSQSRRRGIASLGPLSWARSWGPKSQVTDIH